MRSRSTALNAAPELTCRGIVLSSAINRNEGEGIGRLVICSSNWRAESTVYRAMHGSSGVGEPCDWRTLNDMARNEGTLVSSRRVRVSLNRRRMGGIFRDDQKAAIQDNS